MVFSTILGKQPPVSLCVSVSFSASVCVSVSLSLYVFLSLSLSLCLSVSVSLCLSVSVCLSLYQSVSVCACPLCLCFCLSVGLSVSVSLPLFPVSPTPFSPFGVESWLAATSLRNLYGCATLTLSRGLQHKGQIRHLTGFCKLDSFLNSHETVYSRGVSQAQFLSVCLSYKAFKLRSISGS